MAGNLDRKAIVAQRASQCGDWRKERGETNGLQPLSIVGSHNYSRDTKKICEGFHDYFWGAGSIPWQWEHVSKTSDSFDGR